MTLVSLLQFNMPSNKIFVGILFTFSTCYVIFIEWTLYYFVICKCMNTLGTVQFTFFLIMRLNIIIVTSCHLFIVIFLPYFSSLKLENGLKKHIQNVTYIEYGLVKLQYVIMRFLL